jgi:hypothetical protein
MKKVDSQRRRKRSFGGALNLRRLKPCVTGKVPALMAISSEDVYVESMERGKEAEPEVYTRLVTISPRR